MCDYIEENFKCCCGGDIKVNINWNNGDEYPYCENECKLFSIEWYCNMCNGGSD